MPSPVGTNLAKRPDRAAELSAKMTQAPKARRAREGGEYPTTLECFRRGLPLQIAGIITITVTAYQAA